MSVHSAEVQALYMIHVLPHRVCACSASVCVCVCV